MDCHGILRRKTALTLFIYTLFLIKPSDLVYASLIGDAVTPLSFRLYEHLDHRLPPDTNLAYSPLAISALCSMFLSGVEVDTQMEIIRALHFAIRATPSKINKGFLGLREYFEKDAGNVTLSLASQIFTRKGLRLAGHFVGNVSSNYDANVEHLDFAGDPIGSKEAINKWFFNKTNGKILQAFKTPLNSQTILIALNALYFKGQWGRKFDPSDTKIGMFYTSETKQENTMMMHMKDELINVAFFRNEDVIFELPYYDSHCSMFILLPGEKNALFDVMRSINSSYVTEHLMPRMTKYSVTLTMPKFTLQMGMDITEILQNMGMESLTNPSEAQLNPMFGTDGYYIERIVHSLYLDVNEEGTEAASSTSGMIGLAKPLEIDIKVDRPFLFFIYDRQQKMILYMGRVISPPPSDELLRVGLDSQEQTSTAWQTSWSIITLTLVVILGLQL